MIDESDIVNKQETLEAKLLQYHLCLSHGPFRMAREGAIPRRLAKCRYPACAACMFGKATKQQWRQKSQTNKDKARVPTRPGEVVTVDQIKSLTLRFIAQMAGILTTECYEYVTVFVDTTQVTDSLFYKRRQPATKLFKPRTPLKGCAKPAAFNQDLSRGQRHVSCPCLG